MNGAGGRKTDQKRQSQEPQVQSRHPAGQAIAAVD